MRFGKRRRDTEPGAEPTGVRVAPPPGPVTESWAVSSDAPPAGGAAAAAGVDDAAEAVVDGEAVELPGDPPVAGTPAAAEPAPATANVPPAPAAAQPEPAPATAYVPPAPAMMPFPVAEEPVVVVSSGHGIGGVTPLAESGPAYASGHAAGTAPSWPEPVMELAAERPEVVVGAAFVGGLLLAAILRRLGN